MKGKTFLTNNKGIAAVMIAISVGNYSIIKVLIFGSLQTSQKNMGKQERLQFRKINKLLEPKGFRY